MHIFCHACRRCSSTNEEMYLPVWQTLAGSLATPMWCTVHSAMVQPLSSSRALLPTLTVVSLHAGCLSFFLLSSLYSEHALYINADRYLELIQRFKINQFYATPFVLKYLMHMNADKEDDMKEYDLSTLKTLGSGRLNRTLLTVKGC